MAVRISTDDLELAISWLETYESVEGDEGQARCQRVADWLKAELEDRLIRRIMRDHNVNREMAKRALAKIRAEKAQQ